MQYEFYIRFPDNLILVETTGDEVIIKAAKDNFSEMRKGLFIKWLSQEGFIPDNYQFFINTGGEYMGVKWIINQDWVEVPQNVIKDSNKYVGWIMASFIITWIICIGIIFIKGKF